MAVDNVWIVMQYRDDAPAEFQGAFSAEDKAVLACRTWRYFVQPAQLDEELPDESVPNGRAYYPIVRDS